MSSNYLKTSSAQLLEINEQMKPTSVASGCLANFMDKRFLLTVEHATRNQGNWAIELEYEKNTGAKLYQMGRMNFLMKFTLPSGMSGTVDFSYVEIPDDLQVYRHYLTPHGDTISKDEIHTYTSDFNTQPSEDDVYGFAGSVLTEITPNPFQLSRPYLHSEFRCYEGLTFDRKEGDFFVFKLPYKHPGHKYFKGCSGAPIVNSKNELLGLICNGNTKTDEIYAISLPLMKIALEATILSGGYQRNKQNHH